MKHTIQYRRRHNMIKALKQFFQSWRFIPYERLPARPVITVALKRWEE